MWDHQVEALQNEYQCIVPDLPGHGKSKTITPFSIEANAEAVAAFIQKHACEGKAHIVGHSLGAQIALQLIYTAPEVVDRAMINSALVRPMSIMTKFTPMLVKRSMPLAQKKWFARLQAKALDIPEQYFNRYFEESKSISEDSLVQILEENGTFDLPTGLADTNIPSLILVGQKEKKILHQSAQDLITTIPNAKGYMVKKVGHSFNFEDPHLFNQVLHKWISDQPLPLEKLVEI